MQKMQSDSCMALSRHQLETVSKVVSLCAATNEHNRHALLVNCTTIIAKRHITRNVKGERAWYL